MKKIVFLLISIFAVFALIGCSSNQKVVSDSNPEFYPPDGGMGDVFVMKTVENPFKLPVRYKNIEKVKVALYEVDEKSFFNNAVGGMAAFEGHLDLTKFEKVKSMFEGDKEILNNADGVLNGNIELPITDFGYYYLSFSYPGYTGSAYTDIGEFHTLLEVNSSPKDFNYK
ncbi:hypothetical protein M0P48_03220 [Candidatus Gracilibacteria bacterium]|nr:hypothetical protein [Candidatus Gracilibacteria bacterium]